MGFPISWPLHSSSFAGSAGSRAPKMELPQDYEARHGEIDVFRAWKVFAFGAPEIRGFGLGVDCSCNAFSLALVAPQS